MQTTKSNSHQHFVTKLHTQNTPQPKLSRISTTTKTTPSIISSSPIGNSSHLYASRAKLYNKRRQRHDRFNNNQDMSKRSAEAQLEGVSPNDSLDQSTANIQQTTDQGRFKKQQLDSFLDEKSNEKVALNATILTSEAGLDATTPLRAVPYTKQLRKKRKELYSTFTAMTREIERSYAKHNTMLKNQFQRGNMGKYLQYKFDQPHRTEHKICCVTGPVVPSPSQESYRNKNEFTIGYGLDTENPTEIEIGFLCGRFADGESRVGSPEGSLTAPAAVIEISRQVKKFLNTNPIAKKYSPWIKTNNSGLYRLLTIRDCPVTRQLMICLQINPIAFTPEFNYLTNANPQIEGFQSLPKEEMKKLREIHVKERSQRELFEVKSAAMEEFSLAFRDFCIENFYGGAIWRQGIAPQTAGTDGTGATTFLPPRDTYDLQSDSSPDFFMTQHLPSYKENNTWTNLKLYKGIPTNPADVSILGKEFTTKHNYSLASVIIQTHCGVANSAEMDALQLCTFGSHYIYAQLSKLFFRVSINSFLQVNIRGATTLYNIAQHWAMAPKHDFGMTVDQVKDTYVKTFADIEQKYLQALYIGELFKTSITPTSDAKLDPNDMIIPPPAPLPADRKPAVLFDVCCGTGTIGLINASSARKVVGVDIVQAAIDDAKANAKLNNIETADFLCGKAEDVMETVLQQHRKDIDTSVAILDPPRSGLNVKVLSALRESSLQRIVYISCNQETLADDVTRLAGPTSKSYPGLPFIPIAAIGVDLFPHTEHTEAVMLLERRPAGHAFHINHDAEVPPVLGTGDNRDPRKVQE